MWRVEAALGFSTSFRLTGRRMRTTGKQPRIKISLLHNLVIHVPCCCFLMAFLSAVPLLCFQSVWERRSWRYCGPGEPGICERIHGGLQSGAYSLHLPSAQEPTSWSRLLLWQFLFCQTMIRPNSFPNACSSNMRHSDFTVYWVHMCKTIKYEEIFLIWAHKITNIYI